MALSKNATSSVLSKPPSSMNVMAVIFLGRSSLSDKDTTPSNNTGGEVDKEVLDSNL